MSDDKSRPLVPCQQQRTANNLRLMYTLTQDKDSAPNHGLRPYARLRGPRHYYFSRQTRLKDSVQIMETRVLHYMRVILYTHVFEVGAGPADAINQIVLSGRLAEPRSVPGRGARDICIEEARSVIDGLLGQGFCRVARTSFAKLWYEYVRVWRYAAFGGRVPDLSAADLVHLHRFVNVAACTYTPQTQFVRENLRDHKVLLQNKTKDFAVLK